MNLKPIARRVILLFMLSAGLALVAQETDEDFEDYVDFGWGGELVITGTPETTLHCLGSAGYKSRYAAGHRPKALGSDRNISGGRTIRYVAMRVRAKRIMAASAYAAGHNLRTIYGALR